MTMVEHLLAIADELAKREESDTRTARRRAVSTAYYAIFHALAEICAEELLDDETDQQSDEYIRVYRALEHGTLKIAFNSAPLKEIPEIQKIGSHAVALQSERIRSDYLPPQRLYAKSQCLDLIKSAQVAVDAIYKLGPKNRRALAVNLIFHKNRKS